MVSSRQNVGTMDNSGRVILASVVGALAIVLIWFGAPPVPALVGAGGAGLYLWWRHGRP